MKIKKLTKSLKIADKVLRRHFLFARNLSKALMSYEGAPSDRDDCGAFNLPEDDNDHGALNVPADEKLHGADDPGDMKWDNEQGRWSLLNRDDDDELGFRESDGTWNRA